MLEKIRGLPATVKLAIAILTIIVFILIMIAPVQMLVLLTVFAGVLSIFRVIAFMMEGK